MPAPVGYGGTPTTRIVKSVVGHGRRTATTTDVPQAAAASKATSAPMAGNGADSERARLTYQDEQGPHVFVMRKESLSVAAAAALRGWTCRSIGELEGLARALPAAVRSGWRFYIQDVSPWGTSVTARRFRRPVKTADGVSGPGANEFPLPSRAQIRLADVLVIEFEAAAS